MDDDRLERVRQRAYEIWEREGRSGDPEDHWFEAERELTAGSNESRGADRAGLQAQPQPDAETASSPGGLGAATAAGDYSGSTETKIS